MPEVIPQLLFAIVPIPMAITAVQILMVDLGFEMFTTFSFAFEPPEYHDMLLDLKPRRIVNMDKFKQLLKENIDLESQRDKTPSHGDLEALPNLDEEMADETDHLQKQWKGYYKEVTLMTSTKYWGKYIQDWQWMVKGANSNERLVDAQVLSWAYLEGGLIECGGALLTFFAILYYSFGITPNDAYRAQKAGKTFFKPNSPDLLLNNGIALVSRKK
jgi:sodium/potassium-transporting ATPase subunit alpha